MIDQGLIDISRLSSIASPPLTYFMHAVPPPTGSIYHLDVIEDDIIYMMDQIIDVYEVVDDDGFNMILWLMG